MQIDLVLGHDNFAKKISKKMKKDFVKLDKTIFPNYEIKTTITEPEKVKGKNILLIRRMKPNKEFNPDRCFVDTLFTAINLKKNGANEIHLCWPFLPYAKQDKVFLPGEPQSLKYLLDTLHDAGVTSLFTIMGHPWKKEGKMNYSNLKITNVFGTELLADYIKNNFNLKNAVIVSPDMTAGARVKELCKLLNLKNTTIQKHRNLKTGEISVKNQIDAGKKDVIVVDDFISTGGTILKAKEKCKDCNSFNVVVMHGVMINDFLEKTDFPIICSNSLDTPVSKIDITDLIVEHFD